MTGSPVRPPLEANLTPAEFARWYWTVVELRAFCRRAGLRVGGVKHDLVERVAASLDGRSVAPPHARPRPPGPLCEPLRDTTILPAGQRMTRQLRSYLELRIGDDFRVDSHVRDFMTSSSGTTVADLVANWEATRDTPRSKPDAQFEYNRFSVRWHAAHVGGTAAGCRAAWFVYRSLPLDQRPFPEE
ncbi:MAG: hypothetical protein F2694_05255 [Actinobacteria bacterium]|uniref:Unannotated protein n=1 Tax=freshwater metagenome TaxID=449393 RepID=A0A6J6T3F5_9ZZZZ|nr:hypothetical protein [Actinomycetota bacterium]